MYFNNPRTIQCRISMKEQRKKGLLPLCFSLFLGFIALIWETSVTLVTAKNKHCCWNARYACARDSSALSSPLLSDTVIAQRNSASSSSSFGNYK